MDYKIVFSDIDGTLLNKHRELSPATITEIKKLKNKIPFILISARMPAAMRHLQNELDIEELPLICYNGGLILVNNEIVSSTEIPIDIVEDLSNWNSEIRCHLSLYHQDEWYVPSMDKWALREQNNTKVEPEIKSDREVIEKWRSEQKGAHKIMAMGEESQIYQIRDYLAEKFPDQLHLYRSKNTYLEIAPKRISKYTAIELLLHHHFSISSGEAIAFGDNYNDVEMLKNIGYGVAVGNARPKALKVAKIIADMSIDDGVAKSLKQLFKF
ncbi:MAG: HAD family hydrolase [Flavobacteriaceae bacterium]|nr:HAD family hydrolase [Flavobacteriaceae bacterium]